MLLLREHLRVLRGEMDDERLLRQLELMGLYEGKPTKAGELVLEALEEIGELRVERRFGSEVAQMIYASLEAGYVIDAWRGYLEERGFARGNELTEAARKVYHAYQIAIPRIEIYAQDVSYILSIPTGPAERGEFVRVREARNIPMGVIYALEAMKMLSISPPMGKTVVSLTAIGRLIRSALREIFLSENKVIDEEILEASYRLLRGEPVHPERIYRLEKLGLYYKGKLTYAGRRLGRAYELLRYPRTHEHSPIAISSLEMRAIEAIEKLREKYYTNPEVYPNKERIQRYLNISPEETSRILYTLEALDLIRSEEHPKKKDLQYFLTEHGKKILEDAKTNGFRDIHAYAVKAIMYAFSKRAPVYEWYKEAKEKKLASSLTVTASGLVYLKLSKSIRRKPFLTREEAEIIKKIPSRGTFINSYDLEALDKLEAKGFVDLLPNGFVKLTPVGRLAQIALLDVPIAELEFPINPLIIRILEASNEIGSLDIDYIKKATRLPEEEIKKALIIIRRSGYRGKSGLTDKGKALLEIITEYSERMRLSEALTEEQEAE